MKFITDNFLLETDYAVELYHDYAKDMPIIDYHNHLPPDQIAKDHQFDNLAQVWLNGDHYKWRAMRTLGIDENYITGNASDKEKFRKWAETVPFTLRNPLHHWTHLELLRYFGIDKPLDSKTADTIFSQTGDMLQNGENKVQDLLIKMKVETLCTTDDPLDSLEHHSTIAKSDLSIKVFPAFRPDKAMDGSNVEDLGNYFDGLESLTGITIKSFDTFLEAVQQRHDYFHSKGCRLSDHGLNHLETTIFTSSELDTIVQKIKNKKPLTVREQEQYKSACLLEFAKMDHAKDWVQQFHLGALRNTNKRMLRELGPDTGFDSIGDFPQAVKLSTFFNTLDDSDQLAKTIIYNLNPSQNEVFATMVGNYNDGSVKGKMQFGSGWWYMDQLDGMERQMNALSNMGLLSCFIGMLTDSRSFLSFPRHEYFRRLLCNMLGNDIKRGLVPMDMPFVGKMVQDICYNNAKEYFNF